jgi:hypothetical protein
MPEAKGRRDVFAITERDGHTFWNKCGSSFPNRDGSVNLYLDTLPISGRLQIRDPKPREEFRGEPRHEHAPPPYVGPFEPAPSVQ